jgi:hypothetical protein
MFLQAPGYAHAKAYDVNLLKYCVQGRPEMTSLIFLQKMLENFVFRNIIIIFAV